VKKMSDHKNRLMTAQWVLERNLAWLTAAEVKVGVIVAINTALLGSLGAAFSGSDAANRTTWAYVLATSAGVAVIIGICCAAMAVLPRTTGPEKSLVFFGRISRLDEVEYVNQFKNSTDLELLEDWSAQIHRNAEIASAKYAWVRKSMFFSFFSLIPWLPAIIMFLKK
jgi:Family of unknown function (DUF5706)